MVPRRRIPERHGPIILGGRGRSKKEAAVQRCSEGSGTRDSEGTGITGSKQFKIVEGLFDRRLFHPCGVRERFVIRRGRQGS